MKMFVTDGRMIYLTKWLTILWAEVIVNHMVKNSSQQLNRIFHALADKTRREILSLIAQRECTISDLAEPFAMSLAAISKHVKVLEKAGLLHRTKSGRIHNCQLNTKPLGDAADVIQELQRYWHGKFDALAEFLEATTPNRSKHHSRRN